MDRLTIQARTVENVTRTRARATVWTVRRIRRPDTAAQETAEWLERLEWDEHERIESENIRR
jgi:hypothetical protein